MADLCPFCGACSPRQCELEDETGGVCPWEEMEDECEAAAMGPGLRRDDGDGERGVITPLGRFVLGTYLDRLASRLGIDRRATMGPGSSPGNGGA